MCSSDLVRERSGRGADGDGDGAGAGSGGEPGGSVWEGWAVPLAPGLEEEAAEGEEDPGPRQHAVWNRRQK